jgi:hypothetical protein
MTTYKLVNHADHWMDRTKQPTTVLLIEEHKLIPFDPANTDYQKYLAWLEAGNTPTPADEPTA